MFLQFRQAPPAPILAETHKAHTAVRVVLRLAEQVARHQRRVGLIICDYQDLGRPCQQVDAAAAEQLSLGFGNELVPRAAQNVHRLNVAQPKGHHRHRRYAADDEQTICAGLCHCVYRGRVVSATSCRWGARHDRLCAGYLGGNDAHLCRAEHRVPAARDVTADCSDWNVAVSEDHAGPDLDFQRYHRGHLGFSKSANVVHAIGSVFDRPGFKFADRLFDLRRRQLKGVRVPVVELLAVLANRVHAVGFKVAQHSGHYIRSLLILFKEPMSAILYLHRLCSLCCRYAPAVSWSQVS